MFKVGDLVVPAYDTGIHCMFSERVFEVLFTKHDGRIHWFKLIKKNKDDFTVHVGQHYQPTGFVDYIIIGSINNTKKNHKLTNIFK